MMFMIMSKLECELVLCRLSMSKLVGCAGRGRNEIAKIRIEGVVDKSNEDVWAKAWCRTAMSALLAMDDGGGGLEGVEFMHPCGGFSMLVS